jgi:hypothetical protein
LNPQAVSCRKPPGLLVFSLPQSRWLRQAHAANRIEELSMFHDEPSKPAGVGRLISDLRAAKVELLSAQCAADRLRLQYSIADIVSFGEPQTLQGAIASASALCRFFASIQDQMKQAQMKQAEQRK